MKLAVITARGGSKRIPRKNIKSFCGKPIIAYSIEAALESQCFDEVMVSTDDEEIANISRQYGAVVPFMRSKKQQMTLQQRRRHCLRCFMNIKIKRDILNIFVAFIQRPH